MKKLILLGCLLFLGCAKNTHVIQYAGNDFSHTSSMCLDALLVNMDKDGCVYPTMEMSPGSMTVSCERKLNENESFWTDNIFFMLPSSARVEITNGILVCVDFNYGMFIIAEENDSSGSNPTRDDRAEELEGNE
jgi:hypothetical protein